MVRLTARGAVRVLLSTTVSMGYAAPALFGMVVGLTLGLASNVSGAVLAFYGMALAVAGACIAGALRRWQRRRVRRR